MPRKLLVGWFMKCLACKATFIQITPANWAVGQKGRIFRKDTGQQASSHDAKVAWRNLIINERKFMGFVRCPYCLSDDVRLVEIGDRK